MIHSFDTTPKLRFSLLAAFVTMTIVACIVGGMMVAQRREATRKREQRLELIKANLADLVKQDGLFVTHFGKPRFDGDPDYQSYIWPPTDIDDKAGKPLCSWRVRVDSSVIRGYWNEEHPELNYADMTLPWDSAHNLAYSDEGGGCGGMFDMGHSDGMAHLFAIAGPDTALDPNATKAASELPNDVIVLMEVRDSQTHWMQPGDYNVTDLLAYKGKIGDHLHGLLDDRLHILFADGEVWALDANAPIADLQPFLTITGAKSHDREQILAPHKIDKTSFMIANQSFKTAPKIRFSLLGILITMAIVAGATALVVENQRAKDLAREKALREELRESIPSSMQFLGHALQVYAGVGNKIGNRLPPWPPQVRHDSHGMPLYSWRLHVGAVSLSLSGPYPFPEAHYKEPWSSAANLKYAIEDEMAEMFCFRDPKEDSTTHVFGITGRDTAFDAAATTTYLALPGTIIVAMEVRDSKTEGFEPGDYNVTELLAYKGKIGDHLHGLLPDRLHVLFADGTVWALDPDAPIADLQPFLTITGAKTHDRDELLGPHRVDQPD